MFKSGTDVAAIAKERGLVVGTIASHLAEFIKTGEIKIEDLIEKNKLQELKEVVAKAKFESLSELKNKIDDKFTYAELRMLMNDIEYQKNS